MNIYAIQCSVRLPTLALICSWHSLYAQFKINYIWSITKQQKDIIRNRNALFKCSSPFPWMYPSYFLYDQNFHSVLNSQSLRPCSTQVLTATRKRKLSSDSSPYIVLLNQISTSFWLLLQEINYEVRTNILYTCRKCQRIIASGNIWSYNELN